MSPAADAPRVFRGIGGTYDFVARTLSLGQDPRWRRALVAALRPKDGDRVLDVATGTGLVAREIARHAACRVIGLDQSADMLGETGRAPFAGLVRGRAESLPFADETFDAVSFTYLLRYVDDPRATVRELARVLRPGGRMAALEFGIPSGPLWFPLWRLYTRVALPLLGRLVSARWWSVCRFLGPSIEGFYARHPQSAVESYWTDAGLGSLEVRRMSVGGGIVMSATKAAAPRAPALGASFYALRPGGLRDYWSLLHPPYTVWHLGYVLWGAALGPQPDLRVVAGAIAAFGLATGVAAHSFDELRSRPLGTRIPSGMLIAVGGVALVLAVALGFAGAALVGPALLAFVAAGAALVLLYAFEVPPVHSDTGFALLWGSFPVLTAAYAVGAPLPAAALVAAAAALLSLAQRRLSTRVRVVRRRATAVRGEVRYRDGSRESLDAQSLIAVPESALRLLWMAPALLGAGAIVAKLH